METEGMFISQMNNNFRNGTSLDKERQGRGERGGREDKSLPLSDD